MNQELLSELLAFSPILEGYKPLGGALKSAPEDFIVKEIPLYEASGQGAHLFLSVKKRNISAFNSRLSWRCHFIQKLIFRKMLVSTLMEQSFQWQ